MYSLEQYGQKNWAFCLIPNHLPDNLDRNGNTTECSDAFDVKYDNTTECPNPV
jgi:hypothetical protein